VLHELRTPDTAVIRLETTQPYAFEPGQSLTIETELRPRLWRTYSIANAPREDGTLDLHVQAMDGGPVSMALVRQLHVGDMVRLGPPLGTMVLDDESDRDLLLVAGGTGLAPLKAIVEKIAVDATRRVDLFVGTRAAGEFYDLDDLQRLHDEHTWLSVVLAVSHDDPLEDGGPVAVERGNVIDAVQRRGPWASRDAYVCGSSEMVAATRDHLLQARVPAQRIRYEEFVPSRPSPALGRS
jgi:NAD(P)H-flavin reductase